MLLPLLLLATACGLPAAAPPTPTLPATPTPNAAVVTPFLSQTSEAIDEALALASATCDELSAELRTNPSELPQLRAAAATLHTVARQQVELNTPAVRNALGDLDQALAELDATLGQCGLS